MSNQPQTIDELYPSKWLKAADLPPAGRVATIERTEIQEFHRPNNKKESAMVIFFQNARKALISNKTQLNAIAGVSGSRKFADWPGTRILLKPGIAVNKKPTIIIDRPVDHL